MHGFYPRPDHLEMIGRIQMYVGKRLKNFPRLHAAVKAAYTQKLLSGQIVKTPFGFSMLGPATMQQGDYEKEETKRFLQLIRNYDVFVNVGANLGYYVGLARAQGVKVIAAEPEERNLKILIKNCEINQWTDIELYPVAVGSAIGLASLWGGGTAASLLKGWAGAKNISQLIPVHTLDNLLSQRLVGQKILILMDIEGFELHALKGAQRLLEMNPSPTWVVEICINDHQPEGRRLNPDLQNTFLLFEKNGYKSELFTEPNKIISLSDVALWAKGQSLPNNRTFLFFKPPK